MAEKTWGGEPFWGLGYEWDPEWVLTDRQRELRDPLIELCEKEMRANAKVSDDELKFPRRNLELLGEHGFLALTVPTEYGGLGEDHVAYAMTCETIARYGCASTAMCYVMHMGAVNTLMLRPTEALIDKYIRPLNSGKIGTLSYSDPETGSHFWYPISSGAERSNGGYNVRKKASWTTSGGYSHMKQYSKDTWKDGYTLDLKCFSFSDWLCESQFNTHSIPRDSILQGTILYPGQYRPTFATQRLPLVSDASITFSVIRLLIPSSPSAVFFRISSGVINTIYGPVLLTINRCMKKEKKIHILSKFVKVVPSASNPPTSVSIIIATLRVFTSVLHGSINIPKSCSIHTPVLTFSVIHTKIANRLQRLAIFTPAAIR